MFDRRRSFTCRRRIAIATGTMSPRKFIRWDENPIRWSLWRSGWTTKCLRNSRRVWSPADQTRIHLPKHWPSECSSGKRVYRWRLSGHRSCCHHIKNRSPVGWTIATAPRGLSPPLEKASSGDDDSQLAIAVSVLQWIRIRMNNDVLILYYSSIAHNFRKLSFSCEYKSLLQIAISCLQNYAVSRGQSCGSGARRHCDQPNDLRGMEDCHATHWYYPDLQLLHRPAKSYNLEAVRRPVVQIFPATSSEQCDLVSGWSLP